MFYFGQDYFDGDASCDCSENQKTAGSVVLAGLYAYSPPVRINSRAYQSASNQIVTELKNQIDSLYTFYKDSGISAFVTHGNQDGGLVVGNFWSPALAQTARTKLIQQHGYQPDELEAPGSVGFVECTHGQQGGVLIITAIGIANRFNSAPANSVALIFACYGASAPFPNSPLRGGYGQTIAIMTACADFHTIFYDVLGCMAFDRESTLNTIQCAVEAGPEANGFLFGDGGDLWTPSTERSCGVISPLFARYGAFGDTVWCTGDLGGGRELRILGYRSRSEYPKNGELLATVGLGPEPQSSVVEGGLPLDGYEVLGLVELDRSLRQTWSDPFERTARPSESDWNAMLAASGTNRPWTPIGTDGSSLEVPASVSVEDWPTWVEDLQGGGRLGVPLEEPPADGCDVAVYAASAHYDLAFRERDTLVSLGWDVRLFLGDGSVAEAQEVARTIVDDNTICNESYPDCNGRRYPVKPVLALVGDPDAGFIEIGVFEDPADGCWGSSCYDIGMSGNIGGDETEDVPVYLVPATLAAEVIALGQSAQRYEAQEGMTRRVLFLHGDVGANPPYPPFPQADEALEALVASHTATGYTLVHLRQSDFPGSTCAEREEAFTTAVNAGIDVVCGYGSVTSPNTWPGRFLCSNGYDWQSRLTRQQSLVAILPSCQTAGWDRLAETWHLRAGLFAPVSGTRIAFATGHSEGGYDQHEHLWTEVLGATLGDAETGTEWPRIIWNAKLRAKTQYPFLKDFLRSVAAMGTMVRYRGSVATSVEDAEPDASEPLQLRAAGNAGTAPRIGFRLRAAQRVALNIYDVAGRRVSTLWDGDLQAGDHQFTWLGRTAAGRKMHGGVFFARLWTARDGSATTRLVLVN
ncbi:MAG: hypothetical protein FJ280_21765 [Planctomycetes bacterium]|nr:hypothetical protein [Planctomycetota bacterium]